MPYTPTSHPTATKTSPGAQISNAKNTPPRPSRPTLLLFSPLGEIANFICNRCKDNVKINWVIIYDSISIPSNEEIESLKKYSHVDKSFLLCEHINLPKEHFLSKQSDIHRACNDDQLTGVVVSFPQGCSDATKKAMLSVMDCASSNRLTYNKITLLPMEERKLAMKAMMEFDFQFVQYNSVRLFFY